MTSVIAHEPDCPTLIHAPGEPCCRGEAWLLELAGAAELILYDYAWLLTDKAEDRLDAALQPFREEKK